MEEFYKAIETIIRQTGYPEPVDGADIYEEICDQIDDKEPGEYLLLSRRTDDTFFEYKIQIFEDQFNLSSIDIHTPDQIYHAEFD